MIKKSNEFCVLEKFLKVASEFEKEFVEEIAEEKKEYVRRKEMSKNEN